MLKLRLPGPHPLKFPRKGALAFSALGRGGWENKTSPLHAEAKTSHRETAPHAPCLHRDRARGPEVAPRKGPGEPLGSEAVACGHGCGQRELRQRRETCRRRWGAVGPGRNGKLGPRGLRRRVRSSRRRVTRTRCQVARFSPRLLARPVSSPPSRFSKAGPRPE